jgi:hypothetical protein
VQGHVVHQHELVQQWCNAPVHCRALGAPRPHSARVNELAPCLKEPGRANPCCIHDSTMRMHGVLGNVCNSCETNVERTT